MFIDYHDLSEKDFERLTVCICSEILGPGVVPYSIGKDGSRDARFEGTALHLPNSASPYKGKFIGQAKHTEDPVAKYSDTDFSGPAASSVLSKEIPGIKKLVKHGHLDVYLLFSNRKMSGVAEEPIRAKIAKETGAKTVELFGIERLDHLLRAFPNARTTFGLEPQHLPLLVTCEDLAEVILAISQNLSAFEEAFEMDGLQRVTFKAKNEANGLTDDFADYIRRKYVPQFDDLRKLLAMPGQELVQERYQAAVEEFQEQVVLHRSQYATFDDVLVKVTKLLFYRDSDLAKKKRLVKLVVYYMYWICDIGSEAVTDA